MIILTTNLSSLSSREDYQERLAPYKSQELSSQSLGARYLLSHLLEECGASSHILKKDENNKPYLLGEPKLYVSLSHSYNSALASISKNKIGVDIQKLKPCHKNIAKKYFSREEQEYISVSQNQARDIILFWSFRESLFKLLDFSSARFYSSSPMFSVVNEDLSLKKNITISQGDNEESFWLYHNFIDDFVITAVSKEEIAKILII